MFLYCFWLVITALCSLAAYLLTRRYYTDKIAWLNLDLSTSRTARQTTAANALLTIGLLEKSRDYYKEAFTSAIHSLANNAPLPAQHRMSVLEARLAEIRAKQRAS